MKVTNNNMTKAYTDMPFYTKENLISSRNHDNGHNFDAITIRSNPRQIEERTFKEAVAKKVRDDIAVPVSEERVSELKQQVANHTYKIDPYAIASRILLF